MDEAPIETLPPVEDEYKDKYLRLLADVENTRKRMQKEKVEATRFAVENVMSDILLPIDNLENALKFTDQMSDETRNWALGFQMILAQFKEALHEQGVVAFESVGTLFNPHLHEAVEMEATDAFPQGTILEEFMRGYKCGDRTVRPARVKVAKPLETQDKE